MSWKKKLTSFLLTGAVASTAFVPTALAADSEGFKSIYLNFPEPAEGYALVSQADYMVLGEQTFSSEYDVVETDSQGRVVKCLKYYESDIQTAQTSAYTYDDAGKLKNIQTDEGSMTMFYDDEGVLVSGEFTDDSGLVSMDQYEYDSNHNITQLHFCNIENNVPVEDSSKSYTYTNTYDSNNNLVLVEEKSKDGSIQTSYTYEYDSSNRLIKKFTTEYPNSPTTYEYDGAGNMTKASTYIDGRLEGYTVYQYEKLGEVSPTVTRIFLDVDNIWYADAIQFVYDRILMYGTSGRAFQPNAPLTRAMVAQILYNNAGSPSINAQAQFPDVSADAWYANAVAWAAEQGIVSGYPNGNFGTNDNVTREQFAVMLYNASGKPDSSEPLDFSDAADVSSWAADAVSWAVENGIITGSNKNGSLLLIPQDTTTRAQAAVMIMQYISKT